MFILLQVPKNIPVNHKLQLKQIVPVKNLKPAVIKVYDYYQTSKIFMCHFSLFLLWFKSTVSVGIKLISHYQHFSQVICQRLSIHPTVNEVSCLSSAARINIFECWLHVFYSVFIPFSGQISFLISLCFIKPKQPENTLVRLLYFCYWVIEKY